MQHHDSSSHTKSPAAALRLCCAAAMLLLLPATGLAQSKAALSKGEIFVYSQEVKGSETPQVVVKAVVDAPPQKVWRIIEDCAKYKDRMPRIAESKLVKKVSKNVFICQTTVDLPFPLSNLTATTRSVHKIKKDKRYRRSWSLIKGDYKVNSGSWTLTPFDKAGTRTMVVYRAQAEPTTSVPDWVREKAQKSSLPDMMERVREEVRKLE